MVHWFVINWFIFFIEHEGRLMSKRKTIGVALNQFIHANLFVIFKLNCRRYQFNSKNSNQGYSRTKNHNNYIERK